jgi:hypothetical protein
MAKEEAPAFQYYPKEYLSDAKVRAMSYTERGMYWELVSLLWGEVRLPASPPQLSRILGVPLSVFNKHWPALRPCFRVVEDGSGDIEHGRLEIERRKQQRFRDGQRESGKRGAAKRWDGKPMATLLPKNGLPIESPLGFDGSSISHLPSASPKKEKTLTRARFDRFWAVYPRKVGRAAAEKVWTKINPDDALTDTIIAAVVGQARGWDDPKFIPHARTWLFGRRWEDAAPQRQARINGIEQQTDYRTADYECRHTPKCDSARIHETAVLLGRPEA